MKKIILATLCIAAVGIGVWLSNAQKKNEKLELSGFAFPEPKALTDIKLISNKNVAVTENSFKGHWTFVYVGYTFCPDACPMAMTTLNQLHGALQKAKVTDPVNMMLVSVDPERDTIEKLNSYVTHFNPSFSAATGTPEDIYNFARQVSSIYVIPDDRSDPNYIVDHSSSVILIDPEAAVHAIFTPPQMTASLADDFIKISNKFNN